jgi:hypothetical protein
LLLANFFPRRRLSFSAFCKSLTCSLCAAEVSPGIALDPASRMRE